MSSIHGNARRFGTGCGRVARCETVLRFQGSGVFEWEGSSL